MQLYGHIQQPSFDSQALQGNRLGDPSQRPVTVYLPPGYQPEHRYISLYLLAAHGSTGQGLLNWQPWRENVIQMLDRLMHTGEIAPAILVLPDCWTKLGGSQYLDSAMGNYERYLTQEIVPFVDQHYSTLAAQQHRGILGFSSGGYGALMQGMRHPELFGALACHAGDMYWEYACLPQIAGLHLGLAAYGGAEALFQQLDSVAKDGKWWKIVMALCWSMAHGTNPSAPLGFDLPIDERTGALRQEVWERWLPYDPLRAIDKPAYQEALRGMRLVYLDAGTYDEYHLQVGARLFSQKLSALAIPHQHEEFEGRHSSSDVPYHLSIKRLVDALA